MAARPSVEGPRPLWPPPAESAGASGQSNYPEPPASVRDRALSRMGEAELVLALDDLGAARSLVRAARYLHRASDGYGRPGVYESLRGMVKRSGQKITTLRLAVRKLEAMGFLARTEERVDGRQVTMTWCLWKVPGSEEARPTARALLPMSGGARISGPKYRKWISSEDNKKTTDRVNAAEVVVPAAPLPEQDGGTPDLDPAVAAVLAAEVPDVAERSELAGIVGAWLLRHAIERVILVIRDVAARRRAKHDVHSFGALAASMLADWAAKGRATPRFVKAAARPSVTNQPRPEDEDAERRARRKADALDRERKRLWASLTPEERDPIVAEVRAKDPLKPGQHEGNWNVRIMFGCLEAMDGRAAP